MKRTVHLHLYLTLIIMSASILSGCGSRPGDIESEPGTENPLPPCPDSPNCVRVTKALSLSIDDAWSVVLQAIDEMGPYDIELTPDEYRVDAVFMVVFFRDDMALELEERETGGTLVHIRSSSRVGYYDFGVNRKRVKRLLALITGKTSHLPQNDD